MDHIFLQNIGNCQGLKSQILDFRQILHLKKSVNIRSMKVVHITDKFHAAIGTIFSVSAVLQPIEDFSQNIWHPAVVVWVNFRSIVRSLQSIFKANNYTLHTVYRCNVTKQIKEIIRYRTQKCYKLYSSALPISLKKY